MDTNIVETVSGPASPKDLANARGRLAPFLRDFLIGVNYAYYEPPGAQMLHHNALFIRRHDFSGDVSRGAAPPWSSAQLVGRGDTSGGGVRLAGGLPGLSYVLAQVEQQFLVPKNVQSLIWEDLVPIPDDHRRATALVAGDSQGTSCRHALPAIRRRTIDECRAGCDLRER